MTEIATNPQDAPRRRTAPKAERRQQLIDAAMEVIAQRGLSGTTTGEVTRRAGLSIGLVNHHFGGKDKLLAAVLLSLAEELRNAWRPVFDDPDARPEAKLLAIVDALFHPACCTPVRIRCWFAFFGDAGYRKSYREIVEPFDTDRHRALIAVCEAVQRAGNYVEVDPAELALHVEALADGLWLGMMLYPDDVSRTLGRDQVLAVLAGHFHQHVAGPGAAGAGP